MKNSKLLRVIFSFVLLLAVITSAALSVYAADDAGTGDPEYYYTISGWKEIWTDDENDPAEAVESVYVNDELLPKTGGTIKVPATTSKDDIQQIYVEVIFKAGYLMGTIGDGCSVTLVGDETGSEADIYKNFHSSFYLDIPYASFSEKYNNGSDKLIIVIPARGMSDEEKEHLISSIDVTIEAPVCGTVVTAEKIEDSGEWYYDEDTQDPRPVVSFPSDAKYKIAEAEVEGLHRVAKYWLEMIDTESEYVDFDLYVNTEDHPYMKGGEKPYVYLYLIPVSDEYIFYDTVTVNVNGGTLFDSYVYGNDALELYLEVEVEHVPGDPEDEEGVEPTCLEDGYHYEVVHCTKCGEELSREKVTDKALGHDWGEWKVTKEPTDDADGEETRICKRDPSHIETRPLEKDSPDTSDSGKIILWGTLSAMSLAGLVWLDHESRKHSR